MELDVRACYIVIVIITFRLGFKRVPYFFKKTYQPMLYLVPAGWMMKQDRLVIP